MSAAAAHLTYESLSRLLEGRLDAIDQAKAERHLTSCGRCRSELGWLQRIRHRPGREEPGDDQSGVHRTASSRVGRARAANVWRLGSSPFNV